MLKRIYFITIAFTILSFNVALSQWKSEATDRGAILIGGSAAFLSAGGDLHEYFGDRQTIILIEAGLFYFIIPGIGIGGELSYNRWSAGERSSTDWGIGPKAGYFFDSGNSMIPFVAVGANYLSNSENGYRISFGGGVIFRKEHLGISLEANYVIDSFQSKWADESITGNAILIGVGLSGFLY